MLTAVTEEVLAWPGPTQEACVPMPVLAERENKIPQPARVHLNQFTVLTYRLTSQQLHMLKKEGKGAQGAGSKGRLCAPASSLRPLQPPQASVSLS